jgi:hypothetical protein
MTSRRSTAEPPTDLLEQMMQLTETEIAVDDAERARRRRFGQRALALAGKLHLEIDIDELRGRDRS